MMKRYIQNQFLLIVVILASVTFAFGQKSVTSIVKERNVRAAMNFLASDAMQGRGSGTPFERITAEYVGSRLMEFGLEPAGEKGWDGKPTYVQSVTISRQAFAEKPFAKYGIVTLEHGGEMFVLRTNSAKATAAFQKPVEGVTPRPGSAVLVRAKEGMDQRAAMLAAQNMASVGASIVFIEETPQWRAGWSTFGARLPTFTGSTAKPVVTIVVSTAAANALSNLADGTRIEFGGQLAPSQDRSTWNAIGKLTGSDAALSSEVILLSSHLDHVGVRDNAPGEDKIFNGADDDASGTIAVIELARILASGKRPKRTIYFVCFGSEEAGGFGSNFFVSNLPFPKEKLIANLQFEMIGRPDDKVKPDELWLTGFDRSNLGPALARRGAKLVPDPHPEENFFQRSDNFALARQGIVAHTVSSFGLHTDYHRASDEIKTINFTHMTKAINSMVGPVIWLVNSNFVPAWNEGKRP